MCFVNPLCLKREKGKKLKRKNLEGYWINIVILSFKIVQTAWGFQSVPSCGFWRCIAATNQLLATSWKHFWCMKLCAGKLNDSRHTKVKPWSFEVCAAGTPRTILTRMPQGFLLVGTRWPSPSQSRSDEGSGAVRAFLSNLTGDWTVALKAGSIKQLLRDSGEAKHEEWSSEQKEKKTQKHSHLLGLGVRHVLMLCKTSSSILKMQRRLCRGPLEHLAGNLADLLSSQWRRVEKREHDPHFLRRFSRYLMWNNYSCFRIEFRKTDSLISTQKSLLQAGLWIKKKKFFCLLCFLNFFQSECTRCYSDK